MMSTKDSATLEIERSVEVLERTPRTLRALLGGINEHWGMKNYGEGTFSPFDVVGHLIEADNTNWMPRIRLVLEHGDAQPLAAFDRYAMFEANKGKSMAELLDAFAHTRARNIEDLRSLNLTTSQLDRTGRHPQLGPTTVRNLICAWVVHDLGHLHQIAKSMAFQYRDHVGPFRQLLTILPRV